MAGMLGLAENRLDDVLSLTHANLQQAAELEESPYYRGKALEGQGRIKEARAAYETALRVVPKFAPALHALGTLS